MIVENCDGLLEFKPLKEVFLGIEYSKEKDAFVPTDAAKDLSNTLELIESVVGKNISAKNLTFKFLPCWIETGKGNLTARKAILHKIIVS